MNIKDWSKHPCEVKPGDRVLVVWGNMAVFDTVVSTPDVLSNRVNVYHLGWHQEYELKLSGRSLRCWFHPRKLLPFNKSDNNDYHSQLSNSADK